MTYKFLGFLEHTLYRVSTVYVLYTFDCNTDGLFYRLAFDWVTGKVNIGSEDGFIVACDGRLERPFTCATVLTAEDYVGEIALNPVAG